MEKLGVCLTQAGCHEEALGYLRRTHEFLRASFDEDQQTACISSKYLALCLVATGAHEEAVPHLETAIKGSISHYGPSCGTTLRLQSVLADCLTRGWKGEAIIALGEQVLRSVRPSGLGRDNFLVHIMRHTARAYHKLGKDEQGLACSLQSADLGRLIYGPADCKVLDDLRLSSRCLWRLERRKEAIAVLEKVAEIVKREHRKSDNYYRDLAAELERRRKTVARMEGNGNELPQSVAAES
jgi:tetratricopeptide (TPR) repeat protein